MFKNQFMRFLVAGAISATANYSSRFFFSSFFSFSTAIVLAYFVGMLVAFILMRSHVFPASSGSIARQLSCFAAVNLLAVLQTLAVSLTLASVWLPAIGIVNNTEALAHSVGVAAPIVTSYYGHKYLTFK
ncbi:GtrA family protein [Thauera sp. 27]|uniref:GtrA family protein n=1 Tax=Thauera sp. 27 TaxID=305700 RepID=UPI00055F4381|nr:GtrA family protein [Thauera sp. 27]